MGPMVQNRSKTEAKQKQNRRRGCRTGPHRPVEVAEQVLLAVAGVAAKATITLKPPIQHRSDCKPQFSDTASDYKHQSASDQLGRCVWARSTACMGWGGPCGAGDPVRSGPRWMSHANAAWWVQQRAMRDHENPLEVLSFFLLFFLQSPLNYAMRAAWPGRARATEGGWGAMYR